MLGMGDGDCPFEFNFDATTFKVNPKVGDTITESEVTFKVLDCRGGGCTVEVTKPA